MRYPDGGGLSARGRVQRERVRLEAARLFEQGVGPVQVAQRLRVSTKSAYQWRRRWRAGGDSALASMGSGRGDLPAQRRSAGSAAYRTGARSGRIRLG